MPMFVRVLVGAVALVFTAAAAWANVAFYSSTVTELHAQMLYCSVALATAILKPTLPFAMSHMPGFRVKAIGWFIVALAVIFDVIGALGYVEMTRGANTGAKIEASSEYELRKTELGRLYKSFTDYAGTRATAEVAAELKAARVNAGTCTAKRAHLDVCQAVAALEVEAARAAERDVRENKLATSQSAFDKLEKPAVVADPQGSALQKLAGLIGLNVDAFFADYMFRVLIILMFEVGTPYVSYIALHGGSVRPPVPKPLERPPNTARAPPARRARATAKASPDAVLAFLGELVEGQRHVTDVSISGRKVCAAQRALGDAFGVSGPAMNRHLKALQTAGTIALNTGPSGTEIELLN
jgi:hypothetical protein